MSEHIPVEYANARMLYGKWSNADIELENTSYVVPLFYSPESFVRQGTGLLRACDNDQDHPVKDVQQARKRKPKTRL